VGGDQQQFYKRSGFAGVASTLGELSERFSALDFDSLGEFWLATAPMEGQAQLQQFDPQTLTAQNSEAGQLGSGLQAVDDLGLGINWFAFGPTAAQNGEGNGEPMLAAAPIEGDSEPSIVVAPASRIGLQSINRRGDSYSQFDLPQASTCGSAMAHWQGEPLVIHDCRLKYYDYSNTGELSLGAQLDFASNFAEQPRILALDELPWGNGLVALVEDRLDDTVRRHLAFIEVATGKVSRLAAMPVDSQGLTLKLPNGQYEPLWPVPPPPPS
jgi:hypothetical protein